MDEYQAEQIAIVCRLVNFRTSKEQPILIHWESVIYSSLKKEA